MSFDLYVWHEAEPTSADDAGAKFERWDRGEPEVFTAHPAITDLYGALLKRFPPLESLDDDDRETYGVWSFTPERSDSILELSCLWARAAEVAPTIMQMAAEHGLICYEPGYHIVNPNTPGYAAPFTLSFESLPTMPDPDDRRLAWAVQEINTTNRYLRLTRRDGRYVQVTYAAGTSQQAGDYVLEFSTPTSNTARQNETTDLAGAIRVLQQFRVDGYS